MAGLVVIASDVPSLRHIIEKSRGGLCFRAGDASDLATKINALYHSRDTLLRLAANARQFALQNANREHEMEELKKAFAATLGVRGHALASTV
jgi:glycosyltransferase involved in cell wall biosynthesis